MQQTQLEKANTNRAHKNASLEIRRNVNVATTLNEIQAAISIDNNNGRYYYHTDQRILDKLNAYHKTTTAHIKTDIAEIIDAHVKMLDEEFETI